MANQHRRQAARDAENERLRLELANLRRVVGWIDPAYSAALIDLAELACLDLRRPDDLGTAVNGSEPRLSAANSRAMNTLWYERRKQRERAVQLRRKLRVIVDDDHDPEDGAIPKSRSLQNIQRNLPRSEQTA